MAAPRHGLKRILSQIACQQTRSYHIPYVIETTARGERGFDIYSRLLRDRIVCVNGPIDDGMSNSIVAQMLYLESEHPEKPVRGAFLVCNHLRACTIPVYIMPHAFFTPSR